MSNLRFSLVKICYLKEKNDTFDILLEHTRLKQKIVCALSHLSKFFCFKIKIVEFLLVSIPNLKVSIYKFYSLLFSNSDAFIFLCVVFSFLQKSKFQRLSCHFFWAFIIGHS